MRQCLTVRNSKQRDYWIEFMCFARPASWQREAKTDGGFSRAETVCSEFCSSCANIQVGCFNCLWEKWSAISMFVAAIATCWPSYPDFHMKNCPHFRLKLQDQLREFIFKIFESKGDEGVLLKEFQTKLKVPQVCFIFMEFRWSFSFNSGCISLCF